MSVDSIGSYSDKGGEGNHVKSQDTFRELSGIALFNLGLTEQPAFAFAIIPLACTYSKAKEGITSYNVREARSRSYVKKQHYILRTYVATNIPECVVNRCLKELSKIFWRIVKSLKHLETKY